MAGQKKFDQLMIIFGVQDDGAVSVPLFRIAYVLLLLRLWSYLFARSSTLDTVLIRILGICVRLLLGFGM